MGGELMLWFKGQDALIEKRLAETELKSVELENKILQSNVELEQIKLILRETQMSLNLALTSYQGLADEISTLYEAFKAIMAPSSKHSFSFSFRDDDDDDDGTWN